MDCYASCAWDAKQLEDVGTATSTIICDSIIVYVSSLLCLDNKSDEPPACRDQSFSRHPCTCPVQGGGCHSRSHRRTTSVRSTTVLRRLPCQFAGPADCTYHYYIPSSRYPTNNLDALMHLATVTDLNTMMCLSSIPPRKWDVYRRDPREVSIWYLPCTCQMGQSTTTMSPEECPSSHLPEQWLPWCPGFTAARQSAPLPLITDRPRSFYLIHIQHTPNVVACVVMKRNITYQLGHEHDDPLRSCDCRHHLMCP